MRNESADLVRRCEDHVGAVAPPFAGTRAIQPGGGGPGRRDGLVTRRGVVTSQKAIMATAGGDIDLM
jgi:hypothetical protein